MDTQCKEEMVKYEGLARYVHRCTRKAVKDGLCTQHHPDTQAARSAKASARWEEKQVQWRREHLAKEIGLILLDAGIDSVEKARALLAQPKTE